MMPSPAEFAEVAFWVCTAAVAYAYVGYPVAVWALARCFGRPLVAPATGYGDPPSVTLLIVAHNEAAEIGGRVENALAIDYPTDHLDILVASDGSTDATADIVAAFDDPRVRVIDFPERRGKAATLNDAIAHVSGSVVILSDANTYTAAGSARALARWFADPSVGVVCGRLVLTDPATGRNVDSLYWKYETFLKKCESRLGALLGANGGIYAIRRELLEPIPGDTIVDDFYIPLRAKLITGCRIVYDRDAVACEETPAGIGSEFRRRSRIGAGGFQSIPRLAGLLHPRHGWVAFTFLSHKVLRWLGPFLLIGAVAANVALLGEPLYQACAAAQAAFYLSALLGAYLPARPRVFRFLRLGTMFTGMNGALLVGFVRWVRGSQRAAWIRTPRSAALAEAAR
jgi:cellulose synthase/poly-beta-1,6-N-acetylglucosamine synthase-like glycosyltransferase